MVEAGATLAEILTAGEWTPKGCKPYFNEEVVEAGAVMETHYEASSDEDVWPDDEEASASGISELLESMLDAPDDA